MFQKTKTNSIEEEIEALTIEEKKITDKNEKWKITRSWRYFSGVN